MSQTPTIPLSLYFRFEHNHCTASLGIGGYYKRGYRTHISKAPIRETLAAAIDFNALSSPPSNNNITLLDPFCGSGTLLQEAWSFADDDWPYLQRKRLMPDYVDMLIPSFELTNSSSLLSSSPPDNTISNCWNEWRKARFVGSDVDLDKQDYYLRYVNLQELGLGRAMQYMYDWIVLLITSRSEMMGLCMKFRVSRSTRYIMCFYVIEFSTMCSYNRFIYNIIRYEFYLQ